MNTKPLSDLEAAAVLLLAELEHQITCGAVLPHAIVLEMNNVRKKLCDNSKKLLAAHHLSAKLF